MAMKAPRLRVALLAGTLGQGGAEKQLAYMARALRETGAAVRVFCLTRGEFYEQALREKGVRVEWVGRHVGPPLRLVEIARAVMRFRPHVLQSAHFYTNLYVALAGRPVGAAATGSVRSDVTYEMQTNGRWGAIQLRLPPALVANSHTARRNAEALGVPPRKIFVLPNVIDLEEFDRQACSRAGVAYPIEGPAVINVGNLSDYKRQDRFLDVLALARQSEPALRGVIVGEGPERGRLEARAARLGLSPDGVTLLGRRADVPALLRGAALLALTSDSEGFPNAIMEAMAAGLPVVTTPAGDAASVVEDGATGYVVEREDVEGMAARMVALARSPELRARMGERGRRRVEALYGYANLPGRLLKLYGEVARLTKNTRLTRALPAEYGKAR